MSYLTIEIETLAWTALPILFGKSGAMSKRIPGGARLRLSEVRRRNPRVPLEEHLVLLLHFTKDVAAGVVGSWLFEMLKRRGRKVTRLRIDSTAVELERGKITKIIRQRIENDGGE